MEKITENAVSPQDLKSLSVEEIDRTLQQMDNNALYDLGTQVGGLTRAQLSSVAPLALLAFAYDRTGKATREIMQNERARALSWDDIEKRFFVEYRRRSEEMRQKLEAAGITESLS